MDATAVGVAFVLKEKHLFPNTIPIIFNRLVDTLLLENTPLHFIEELFFGEGTRLSLEFIVVVLALGEAGVALTGEKVDVLLESLVIEVVVLDLFEKTHKGFFKVVAAFLDVN